MLRILFFNTGGAENISGGERSLALILRHLKTVQPLVLVTTAETEFCRELKDSGLEVVCRPFEMMAFNQFWGRSLGEIIGAIWNIFSYNTYVRRLLSTEKIHIVHCNALHAFILSFAGVKLAGKKLAFNIRGTPRIRWLWQWALWVSDAVIVPSTELRDRILQQVRPCIRRRLAARISVAYSGIEYQAIQEYLSQNDVMDIRRGLGMTGDECAIGHIAAIRPLKAQWELIDRVIPHVCSALDNVKFYFVGSADYGDTDYEKECKELVLQKRLTHRVKFVPYQKDVYRWYAALDLTVLASEREGLARTMIESLAFGKPMVSFSVASAREVLEQEQCGFVVPHGAYAELAAKIIELCRNPELRQRLGQNGRGVVQKKFDISDVARGYEQVYLSL